MSASAQPAAIELDPVWDEIDSAHLELGEVGNRYRMVPQLGGLVGGEVVANLPEIEPLMVAALTRVATILENLPARSSRLAHWAWSTHLTWSASELFRYWPRPPAPGSRTAYLLKRIQELSESAPAAVQPAVGALARTAFATALRSSSRTEHEAVEACEAAQASIAHWAGAWPDPGELAGFQVILGWRELGHQRRTGHDRLVRYPDERRGIALRTLRAGQDLIRLGCRAPNFRQRMLFCTAMTLQTAEVLIVDCKLTPPDMAEVLTIGREALTAQQAIPANLWRPQHRQIYDRVAGRLASLALPK